MATKKANKSNRPVPAKPFPLPVPIVYVHGAKNPNRPTRVELLREVSRLKDRLAAVETKYEATTECKLEKLLESVEGVAHDVQGLRCY